MKYVYLDENGIVAEVIPEHDPDFPGIPVTERYSPDFLANTVAVDDSVDVEQHMTFDPDAKTFTRPPAENYQKLPGGGGRLVTE